MKTTLKYLSLAMMMVCSLNGLVGRCDSTSRHVDKHQGMHKKMNPNSNTPVVPATRRLTMTLNEEDFVDSCQETEYGNSHHDSLKSLEAVSNSMQGRKQIRIHCAENIFASSKFDPNKILRINTVNPQKATVVGINVFKRNEYRSNSGLQDHNVVEADFKAQW